MNLLFIMNGIGAVGDFPGISGGDVRWIEIAKHWQMQGYEIHVLTLEAGVKLCERLGLKATFHVFHAPNEYSLQTYLIRFLKSKSIPETLNKFQGVIYSTTEHIYDVLPALKIKENGKDNIWVATVHWVAPLKRKGTSWLNSFLFFCNQRLGFRYIRDGADVVLAISENTAEQIKHIGITKNVFKVDSGVDYQKIGKISCKVKTKRYSAVFMKRLDGTKGVFDVIEIWKDVVKARQHVKLGMIGLGTKEVMVKLRKMVEKYNLADNVDFLGPIYDFSTKFSILASSSLFVLPSYEENWAIVIGEAMAAGVPVICYDLPDIRSIWEDKVVWVTKGDKKKFAKKIIEFLDNEHARNELSKVGTRFVKRYDWRRIAEKEMIIITNAAKTMKSQMNRESHNRALEKNLKNHWESFWGQTTGGTFLKFFSNYFSKKGTEACWRMYSDLLRLCRFNSNPRILELGAGSGNMTLRILKKFGGKATLVDYSAQALHVAKQNALREGLTDRISFIQDDVFNFIPKRKYALVHSGGLIEHFPIQLIEELVRKHVKCANAHGYVILMVPAPIWWYKTMRRFLEVFHWWPKDFEMPLDKDTLEDIAEKNGLKILKAIQSGGLARASAVIGTPV